jgi:L-2-hydroxyglutarate oxidase LhgO
VHLTLTIDGKVKIGPTAIPLLNREQYQFFDGWNLRDMNTSFGGIASILRGNSHDLLQLARSEFPKIFLSRILKDATELAPTLNNVSGWEKIRPGIRAQLVDTSTGSLVTDFIVVGDESSTHVLNAVSPGWTASIPFGKHIAGKALESIC